MRHTESLRAVCDHFVAENLAMHVAVLIVQRRGRRVETESAVYFVAVLERKNMLVITGRIGCDATDGEARKSGAVDVGELAHSASGLRAAAAACHDDLPSDSFG